MEFISFSKAFYNHFKTMSENQLFIVECDKDEMWNLYLDSFPEGINEIFQTNREYDCTCCHHFINLIGNVVSVKDGKVETVWDMNLGDFTYQPVCDAMRNYVLNKKITDIFLTKESKIGVQSNPGYLKNGNLFTFNHLYVDIPSKNIFKPRGYLDTFDSQLGTARDTKNVFKRSLDELTTDSVDTALELIAQNSLYRGEEHKSVLELFRKYKIDYDELSDTEKELFVWENAGKAGISVGRIRNHAIGTLLIDISNGIDLETAVRKYETVVAPANYHRPKEIFTEKMLKDMQKQIIELGYLESLPRRFATLDDVTVNNILFANRNASKRIEQTEDIFTSMSKNAKKSPKKFDRCETVTIDKFISDILPTVKSVEAYFDNKVTKNLVSLIAPVNKNSRSMFKWNNNFSWAYTGNMTDPQLKENVKNAGGSVTGDLRFSIQWNDVDEDKSDLDAHCIEPGGEEIYFGHKVSKTGGILDIDITHPGRIPAVENITWESKKTMKDGTYRFFVNCYSDRGNDSGFRAEIEFDGQIYSYDYRFPMQTTETIEVARVILKNGKFALQNIIDPTVSNTEMFGLTTNNFVPVSVISYSPNYWDEQNGIGNKHYFFFLEGCKNDERPNGFFNEYLNNELTANKRAFAALGSKVHVEDCDDQLSGLGFSSTRRAELIVKVTGVTERILKIKF